MSGTKQKMDKSWLKYDRLFDEYGVDVKKFIKTAIKRLGFFPNKSFFLLIIAINLSRNKYDMLALLVF